MKFSFLECIRRKYLKRLLKWTLMKKVWETLGYNLLYLPYMYFLAWVIEFGWFATHHYCSRTFLNTSFLPPSHGHNVLESRDTALCSTALQDNTQCWNVAITEDTGRSAVVSRSWLLSLAHNPLCSRKEVSILLSATAKEVVTNIWTYSVGMSCSNYPTCSLAQPLSDMLYFWKWLCTPGNQCLYQNILISTSAESEEVLGANLQLYIMTQIPMTVLNYLKVGIGSPPYNDLCILFFYLI